MATEYGVFNLKRYAVKDSLENIINYGEHFKIPTRMKEEFSYVTKICFTQNIYFVNKNANHTAFGTFQTVGLGTLNVKSRS